MVLELHDIYLYLMHSIIEVSFIYTVEELNPQIGYKLQQRYQCNNEIKLPQEL